MTPDYFRSLFAYGWWARDRLLAAAAGLSEPEYRRPNGFTFGSIRGILTHTLDGEALWVSRWLQEPGTEITEDQVPTIGRLADRWSAVEVRTRAFLDQLDDERLRAVIVSRRRNGEEIRRPLWHDLAHVVNHSTQHRSEAAEALTMIGRSPGDLDLSIYLRAHDSAGQPGR